MGASNRLFLIHWNPAEAEAMAAPLRRLGWQVETEAEDGARAARRIGETRPGRVVVSLARLPSHGIRTAEHLLERAATRAIPLLFTGGKPEAVSRARQRCPAANFAAPDDLLSTVGPPA